MKKFLILIAFIFCSSTAIFASNDLVKTATSEKTQTSEKQHKSDKPDLTCEFRSTASDANGNVYFDMTFLLDCGTGERIASYNNLTGGWILYFLGE